MEPRPFVRWGLFEPEILAVLPPAGLRHGRGRSAMCSKPAPPRIPIRLQRSEPGGPAAVSACAQAEAVLCGTTTPMAMTSNRPAGGMRGKKRFGARRVGRSPALDEWLRPQCRHGRTAGRGGHPPCWSTSDNGIASVRPLKRPRPCRWRWILTEPPHPATAGTPLPGPDCIRPALLRFARTEVWPASGWEPTCWPLPSAGSLGRKRRQPPWALDLILYRHDRRHGSLVGVKPSLGCATAARACIGSAPGGSLAGAATPGWRGGTPPSMQTAVAFSTGASDQCVGRLGDPQLVVELLTHRRRANGAMELAQELRSAQPANARALDAIEPKRGLGGSGRAGADPVSAAGQSHWPPWR